MPIRTSNLVSRKASTTVEFEGESARLDYHPGKITPALIKDVQASSEDIDTIARTLVDILVDWDVTQDAIDDDGKAILDRDGDVLQEPVPIEFVTISQFDIAFLGECLQAIFRDSAPGKRISGN